MPKVALWLVIVVIALTTLNCTLMVLICKTEDELLAYLGLSLLALLCLAPTVAFLHRPGYGVGSIVLCGAILFSWAGLMALLTRPEALHDHMEDIVGSVAAVFFMGFPTGIAMMVINKPWGKWFGGTACAVGLIFTALVLLAIWLPKDFNGQHLRDRLGQTGVIGFGVFMTTTILLLNLGRGDRRYFRWPGVLLGLAAFLVLSVPIWSINYDNEFRDFMEQEKKFRDINLMGHILWTAVGTLALVNMLLMTWRPGLIRWFQWIAISLVVLTGITVAYGFMVQMGDSPRTPHEAYSRLLGVLGTLTVGAVAIMLSLRTMLRLKAPPPPPSFQSLTLHCPNCSQVQPMGLAGACVKCLLQFKIALADPRCPSCNHLLINLTSDRCPECGTAISRPAPLQPATVPIFAPPAVASNPTVPA